jgi:hypothetical protein
MSTITPPQRPQQRESTTRSIIADHLVPQQVVLVGIRGYYDDTFGAPDKNDRGFYDDALFLVTPNQHRAFNANTDPSRFGARPNGQRGLALLKTGVWLYRIGQHGIRSKDSYTALVQAQDVTIVRDAVRGKKPVTETGRFGINIHRGGVGTTGSEGCQTVPPSQWAEFIAMTQSAMREYRQTTVPYILVEGT